MKIFESLGACSLNEMSEKHLHSLANKILISLKERLMLPVKSLQKVGEFSINPWIWVFIGYVLTIHLFSIDRNVRF